MIVLDTNVISEPLRPSPDPRVAAWLDDQHIETLYLAAATLAEIRYGIAILPEGTRKSGLRDRFEGVVLQLFAGRVLAFDDTASKSYAQIQSEARSRGRALSVLDGLIASTCAAHGFALATRNVRDFEATGVDIVNPWAQ